MTRLALEIGPANLCVSARRKNQGHVEWIEACASMREGERFHVVGATLALFQLRDLRAQRSRVTPRELAALHGFESLSAEDYVNQCFERFDPFRCDRLLVVKEIHQSSSVCPTLDLALLRRSVELTGADLLLAPWPPPGPTPERWASYFSSTAITITREEPAWLYQRARERWPIELVQREELERLISGDPSLQKTGT